MADIVYEAFSLFRIKMELKFFIHVLCVQNYFTSLAFLGGVAEREKVR